MTTSLKPSVSSLASIAKYLALCCLLVIIASCDAVSDSDASTQHNEAIELGPFPALRLLRQAKRHLTVPIIEVKRVKNEFDFGWDQCEFSPMSCLLRKRRAAEFQ